MIVPENPKIYHIVHMDRLPSIIADGGLLSDAQMIARKGTGTTIGMNNIKERRLKTLTLSSYPDLYVGACVPFYFCPRSIMLYILSCNNHPDVLYRGGQAPIIHLEIDLHTAIKWVEEVSSRWAFTSSNAGSHYFEDYNDLASLNEIDWGAVNARNWSGCQEKKQAEFLIENSFPFQLVERIGVHSHEKLTKVNALLAGTESELTVEIKRDWYY